MTVLYLTSNSLKSIDSIFQGANWLEREFSEMYGLFLIGKNDSRNLLLDYNFNENPMLKNYPCAGLNDIYYNNLSDNLLYIEN
jgi:NADH-quinone oxidoreductase subunit C